MLLIGEVTIFKFSLHCLTKVRIIILKFNFSIFELIKNIVSRMVDKLCTYLVLMGEEPKQQE
jgi:hypothetical protein